MRIRSTLAAGTTGPRALLAIGAALLIVAAGCAQRRQGTLAAAPRTRPATSEPGLRVRAPFVELFAPDRAARGQGRAGRLADAGTAPSTVDPPAGADRLAEGERSLSEGEAIDW